MPELPEVETMRRGVAGLRGRQIRDVRRTRCRRKPIRITPQIAAFRRRVAGKTVTEVGRVGKRVVLVLDSGDRIVLEPRMTGLVLLADPPSQEHLRFRMEMDEGPPLLYWDRRGLGSVQLYSADEFDARFAEAIGPDALTLTPQLLRERLGASRRPIKVGLLDQKALAGVGNLYASEILHLAKVPPQISCCDLSRPAWKRIHAALLDVLHSAIAHEGSTLSDGTYRNALNQNGGYQNLHRVYDREGESCMRCRRGQIVRIVQAQRSTFYCPVCQPMKG